ncbi:PIN domain-containing protein [Candidatus Woesearchaeota archaeon]|nr:PIN domain-containing protein [Candidatus Woesearchaeota archaeon]
MFGSLTGVCFSAITETELLGGRSNDKTESRADLLKLLALFQKIPVDNPLAVLAGDIVRKYDLEVPDAIIAATAISNNLVLITRNSKRFRAVSNLKIRSPYYVIFLFLLLLLG